MATITFYYVGLFFLIAVIDEKLPTTKKLFTNTIMTYGDPKVLISGRTELFIHS